jgi:cyclophilin family peptidyl-prolyl cis-trans isomerase
VVKQENSSPNQWNMTLTKFFSIALISLALSACFHVQLTGSVGGADLSIAPLRSPNTIVGSATSLMPADLVDLWGAEKWAEQPSLVQLLFVGITELTPDGLDPDALYLVTASGGQDFDPEVQRVLSDSPVTVQGSWHAIATGQRIMAGNFKVSALTDALYRQMQARIEQWSDAEILARLHASAQLVVGDVDKNGTVDYDDVLRWHRTVDGAYYLGDLTDVDALSAAIIAGQPASMLSERAKAVLGTHEVVMEFDAGTVTVETLNWDSPITAANFLAYVSDGFYNQMLVHRAIDDFMIQMGLIELQGTNENGQLQWAVKTPGSPIVNESSNRISNVRGTLAMARTSAPDSAAAQFFINQANNTFLNFGSSNNPDGYAVFARVLSGMEVVDEIAGERTTSVSGIGNDVPARGVVLESVSW